MSLGEGIRDFFYDSCDEVVYAGLELGPLIFQDDVARLADSPASVQAANIRMEALSECKLLDYNLKKSAYMVVGKKAARDTIKDDLRCSPITLCGKEMPQVAEAKYLGDWISEGGLSASIECTIKKRVGLATSAIYEIRSVVDDCRSKLCGSLQVGLEIWELAVIPMLLFNSECWIGITNQHLTELETLQKRFLKTLMAVGSGCPTPSLYWETGTVGMKWRIIRSKLIFYHHLLTLPETSLANEVLKIQESFELPGLVSECKDFMTLHDIKDAEEYSKLQWKKLIKAKILELNEAELVEQSQTYKKIDFTGSKFICQNYLREMHCNDARSFFKLKTQMMPTVQMNFMRNPEFAKNLWTCQGCGVQKDSQAHIIVCPGYANLRTNRNLNSDGDLVDYFREVIRTRLEAAV